MNKIVEQFQQMIGLEAKNGSPSPFGQWLNGKMIAAEEGKLTIEFTVREEFTNPAGIMHGGVFAGIIDEVIGMTTFSLGKSGFYVASNLNIDFLRPGNVGEVLTVKSEVIRAGKTMAHVECRVYGNGDKLLAKAASNLLMTEYKKQAH